MRSELVKIMIVSAALSLILILLLFFLGFDISKKMTKIKQLRSDYNFSSNKTANLAVLRQDIAKVQPYLEKFESIVSNRDKLINLPRDMSALASQNGISFNSTFSGENQGKLENDLSWIALTMSVEGSLSSTTNFLKTIETSNYYIKLNTADFISKNDNSFRTLFSGRVFYFDKVK